MFSQTVKLKTIAIIKTSSNGIEKFSLIDILHQRFGISRTQSQVSDETQLNVMLAWRHLAFETLRSQLRVAGVDSLLPQEIVNVMNQAFLEPIKIYRFLQFICLIIK